MTAALYDEVVAITPAPKLTVVPNVAPTEAAVVKKETRRREDQPFGAGSDPLVDGAARLLTVPLRHLYAALWRAGVLDVQA
ncbi:Rv1535 family protein [Mycobacterium kubicae]|uniref:Rv1535 family protein n=1 Tax=Mycobacterium kubicae TaxID=120959 RepID=UPI0007FFC4FE|nr:Rv1535 family protein [Mycobacterium kubicae]OBF18253.1 hypothetical protein A5725_21510 [Mycobacterium kubicae]OBK40925.1 hypothetical protein A5657_08815 [Mycobacterium kubicae]